jgi:hypothetical protein
VQTAFEICWETGRSFKIRYKGYLRDIRNNGQNSKFAQQIVNTIHEYETMEEIMKILHVVERGNLLNTYENFHIYEISKQNIQLNDNLTEIHNPIYDLIIATYQNRGK